MAKQVVNVGTIPDDGTGDDGRDAFIKVNDNFTELYDADGVQDTAIALNTLKTGVSGNEILKDGSIPFTGSQNTQNLLPVTDNTYNFGNATVGYAQIHLATASSGGKPRDFFNGFHIYGAESDFFIGSNNSDPVYYTQNSTPINVALGSGYLDYSNLWQGGINFQILDLNYLSGDGTAELTNANPNILRGATRCGAYDATNAKGGGGIACWGRGGTQTYTYMCYDTVDVKQFNLLSSDTSVMGAGNTTSWAVGGTNVLTIKPALSTGLDNHNAIDLGEVANAFKNIYGAKFIPTTTTTYTINATSVLDRTLLASASATTINNNNVLAALITDLKALGIIN